MIGTKLFGSIFLAAFGVSWGFEDLYIVPVCEYKGPEDVYMDYSNTGLNRLSKSSALDSSIKCLNFDENRINEIDQEAFDNVPEMFYLNLAKNPVHIKNFINTAIPNLETLILDGPFDNSYDGHYNAKDWYESESRTCTLFLPELRKLSLRYYRDYSDLIDLWLVVLDVPMLTHLYLSGNQLTTIANLARMPNLTHLNVDDNNMRYISGSFFKNLEYLSMERNNIQNVCGTFCKSHSMTPHGMHNLKYLSLAKNVIESIGSDAFVDLENLLVLNLAENKINDFQQHIFNTMPKLQNLTLDKNNLSRVPDIRALQELQVLSLNENNIKFIDETTFGNMTKLAMVYLGKNGMTTIADKTFGNLPTLAILDLSWNSINFLPEEWISSNNNLKVLHLDGNQFTDIRNMSLKRLDYLDTLNAILNPIEEISIGSLIELPRNISIKLLPPA